MTAADTVKEHVKAHFSAEVTRRREALQWKPWELAGRSGLSPDTIRRYELRLTNPSISDAYKIAAALGCRVSDLLPDQEEAA